MSANDTPIDSNIPQYSSPPLLNKNRKMMLVAVAIIIIVVVAVVAVFTLKINTKSNKADLSTYDMAIMYGVPGEVYVTGGVINNGNKMAYNCQLHIKGVYPNGVIALDTYIEIGNQGTIPAKTIIDVTESANYTVQANLGTPNWSVTAVGTNNP